MKIAKFVPVALALLAFLPTQPARANQIENYDFIGFYNNSNQFHEGDFIAFYGSFSINTTLNDAGGPNPYYTVTDFSFWVPPGNQAGAGDCGGTTGYLYTSLELQTSCFTMDIGADSVRAFLQSGGSISDVLNSPFPEGIPFDDGRVYPSSEPSTLPLLATGFSLFGIALVIRRI